MNRRSEDRFPVTNWLNTQKGSDIAILACLLLTNLILWGSM